MGYNIEFFKATTSGYASKIETLSLKIPAEFTRVLNRKNENAPAYELFSGELRIGLRVTHGQERQISLRQPRRPELLFRLLQPLPQQRCRGRLHPRVRPPPFQEGGPRARQAGGLSLRKRRQKCRLFTARRVFEDTDSPASNDGCRSHRQRGIPRWSIDHGGGYY